MEKERLLENIKTALQNKDSRVLFEEIDELHPADIVEILPDLEEQEQKTCLNFSPMMLLRKF